MENDFRKLWLAAMVAVAVTMLICIGNSHGQKRDKNSIKSNITNLDILYPPDASGPMDTCVVMAKGLGDRGENNNNFKRGEILDILPMSSCTDDPAKRGVQTEIFLFQVVTLKKNQATGIMHSKNNLVKKVRMDTTDLTPAQQSDTRGKRRHEKALGNWRLIVE